jgi:hypothetical protein
MQRRRRSPAVDGGRAQAPHSCPRGGVEYRCAGWRETSSRSCSG